MANPLQQLLALAQGGRVPDAGMMATGPADMVSEAPSIVQQLQQLLGGGGGMPPAPAAPPARGPMFAALQDRMAAQGIPSVGPSSDAAMSIGTNYGRAGPGTDSDYYEMHEANQGVRGDLPPQPQRDYSGYGEEMEPLDDPRQTPLPEEPPEAYKPNVGAPGAPGQSIMGAYLKSQAAARDGTQAEIDDISAKMGGSPEDDGNFPTQKEIDDLNAGRISPVMFDKKWGKGAAAEMQESSKPDVDDDDDDGDHEYR